MFELAWPWILLLLPLPLLVWFFCWPAKVISGYALRVPFFDALKAIHTGKHSHKNNLFKTFTLILIWCLLVFAASGPEWLGEPRTLPQRGRDIFLAIDISGSMQLPDMQQGGQALDRLSVVKQVANQFVKERKGDRLGLILFGTRAYLQTPLTFDRKTVSKMLNDATIGLAGPRTAIGDAIGLAIKRLQQEGKGDRVLVLLTDGVNNTGSMTPLEAANIAAQYGIKIYTIGIGAERMLLPDFFGVHTVNPSADLDEKTLQEIAKKTEGVYFRARDKTSLINVYQAIDRLEPVVSDAAQFRMKKPLYPWFLSLALLLSVLLLLSHLRAFRRQHV